MYFKNHFIMKENQETVECWQTVLSRKLELNFNKCGPHSIFITYRLLILLTLSSAFSLYWNLLNLGKLNTIFAGQELNRSPCPPNGRGKNGCQPSVKVVQNNLQSEGKKYSKSFDLEGKGKLKNGKHMKCSTIGWYFEYTRI